MGAKKNAAVQQYDVVTSPEGFCHTLWTCWMSFGAWLTNPVTGF